MSKYYLCYDVRGIQTYIFKISSLKYIIGGSTLIANFDETTVPQLNIPQCEHIYSAGGKGAFNCETEEQAEKLQVRLIEKAHAIGLDLRIGINEDFSKAAHNADKLYPYLPESLEGHPCEASGLYPVENGGVHPIVEKRIKDETQGGRIRDILEDKLLDDKLDLGPEIDPTKCHFFHNVSATGSKGETVGYRSLGSRNRWAIVCMDGNDMGKQFCKKDVESKSESLAPWIKDMSKALNECSVLAARHGIEMVVRKWFTECRKEMQASYDDADYLTLPIRPLVVGGDDIIVLCHVNYASEFVKEVSHQFTEISGKTPEMWPATNGKLTISAGILYCSTSLPLHTAIPYAESVLASAKQRGRLEQAKHGDSNKPTPPCIDWEQVTDSLIDTPAARRQRELRFKDEDIGEYVELTRRPYTLEAYADLEKTASKLDSLPNTIRHRILKKLRAGYWDRRVFVAQLAKNQSVLASYLEEDKEIKNNTSESSKSRWHLEVIDQKRTRSTDVVDAILLLEERGRMHQEAQ